MKRAKHNFDERLIKAVEKRNALRAKLFDTSDSTRENIASVEHGLKIGKMLLGVFRSLTNKNLNTRERWSRVISRLGTYILTSQLSKMLTKK